jgi:hypothetical protein
LAKKQSTWLWIGIAIVAVLVLSGSFSIKGLDFSSFDLSKIFGGGSGLVDVNKQIKYTLVNYYAGSAIASSSNTISVYDSDGETLLESNLDTDAAGQGNTAFSYNSGKMTYMKYESSNDKIWWQITVPQMNPQDAQAATYNLIELRAFASGTYSTDSFLMQNGTACGAAYDASSSGTSMSFTYKLSDTGSDNTGLMNSFDPLYKCNYYPVVYMKLSGTGYEHILPYGFDYDFTLGTTHYLAKVLDPYKLTRHKVGNDYRSTGSDQITFTLDMTGVTGGDSVVLLLEFEIYSDPAYCSSHGGSYGTEAYQGATATTTITP